MRSNFLNSPWNLTLKNGFSRSLILSLPSTCVFVRSIHVKWKQSLSTKTPALFSCSFKVSLQKLLTGHNNTYGWNHVNGRCNRTNKARMKLQSITGQICMQSYTLWAIYRNQLSYPSVWTSRDSPIQYTIIIPHGYLSTYNKNVNFMLISSYVIWYWNTFMVLK